MAVFISRPILYSFATRILPLHGVGCVASLLCKNGDFQFRNGCDWISCCIDVHSARGRGVHVRETPPLFTRLDAIAAMLGTYRRPLSNMAAVRDCAGLLIACVGTPHAHRSLTRPRRTFSTK